MNRKDAKVIRKNYELLVKTLEAQNLSGYLYQEGALSDHDIEVINVMGGSSRKQNEKLLSKLKKRKNGLKLLIKALLLTEVQGFLGNELLEKVAWSEKEMETFKLELKGEIDPQLILEVDVATLKRENSQLKSKTDKKINHLDDKNKKLEARVEALETELESLKQEKQRLEAENQSLLDKTSKQEEQTSKTSEQNHYGLSARRYAISSKVGGREQYLRVEKLEMLKREIEDQIEKIKDRASPTSLQEEYRHELHARRNATSYAGGRASYLADVKKPQSVRQN